MKTKKPKLVRVWYYDPQQKEFVRTKATEKVEGPNTYYFNGKKLIRYPVFRSEEGAVLSQISELENTIAQAESLISSLKVRRSHLSSLYYAILKRADSPKEKGSKKKSC